MMLCILKEGEGVVSTHPADGHNLHGEGVLVVVGGAVLIVGHQLLVAAILGWHHALYKTDELQRMRSVVEEEIHTLQSIKCAQTDQLRPYRKGPGKKQARQAKP